MTDTRIAPTARTNGRDGPDGPDGPPRPGRRRALAAGLALAAVLGGGCSRPRRVAGRPVPRGATVLALGDSLTFGTGAAPDAAYPTVLAGLTGWTMINAGVPGDTSAQALARTAALLDEHRPALVLLGIGGNDFLRRLDAAGTRENIRRIAQACTAAGAQVMLIAVPEPSLAARFTGSLSDHDLYAELAGELVLPLFAGGWAAVLADEKLRSDAIHANAAGYAAFARALAAALREARLLEG